MTGAERLRAAGKGMAVCGLFAAVFYRSMKVFWMMVPVGVTVALVSEKKRLKNRRMDLLAAQFKEKGGIVHALRGKRTDYRRIFLYDGSAENKQDH